jgi:hypothetical protein
LRLGPWPGFRASSTILASLGTDGVDTGSGLLCDDVRDGMLRKDRFFFGASAGFRAACEGVSFDVGIESTLATGDSVCSPVGSIGRGACEKSRYCPIRKGARTGTRYHIGASSHVRQKTAHRPESTYNCCSSLRRPVARPVEQKAGRDRRRCCCCSCGARGGLNEAGCSTRLRLSHESP